MNITDVTREEEKSFLLEPNKITEIHLPEASLVFHTSGSSGEPKGIVLSRAALRASARAVNDFLCVTEKSRWGLVLPWWHIGGYSILERSKYAACEFKTFSQKWNPQRVAAWLAEEEITHLALVPTQVYDLVQAHLHAPAKLSHIVVGGGRFDEALKSQAKALGWNVLSSYGMTEAASQIATDDETGKMKILPHWQTRLSSNNLLEIKGEALFSGYWMNDTFMPRSSDWYPTHDCVSIENDYITFHHRADTFVKILGELVDPQTCEKVLLDLGMPHDSFTIIVEPDARKGSQLILIHEWSDEAHVAAVVARYNAAVKGYERIHTSRFIEQLPRSSIGKILRTTI